MNTPKYPYDRLFKLKPEHRIGVFSDPKLIFIQSRENKFDVINPPSIAMTWHLAASCFDPAFTFKFHEGYVLITPNDRTYSVKAKSLTPQAIESAKQEVVDYFLAVTGVNIIDPQYEPNAASNRKPNVYDLAIEELHKLAEQFRGYSREFNKPIEAAKNLSIGEIKKLCEEFQALPCVLKNTKVEVTNATPAAEPDASEFAIKHAVQAIKDSEPQEPIPVSEKSANAPKTQLKLNWFITPFNVAIAYNKNPLVALRVRPNAKKPGLFICEFQHIGSSPCFLEINEDVLTVEGGQYECEQWYSENYGEKTDKAETEPEKLETAKAPNMKWKSATEFKDKPDGFFIGKKFRYEKTGGSFSCNEVKHSEGEIRYLVCHKPPYSTRIEYAELLIETPNIDACQKEANNETRKYVRLTPPAGMEWKRATDFYSHPTEFFIGKSIKWLYDSEVRICNQVSKDEEGFVMSLHSTDHSTGIGVCEILLPIETYCYKKGCTQKPVPKNEYKALEIDADGSNDGYLLLFNSESGTATSLGYIQSIWLDKDKAIIITTNKDQADANCYSCNIKSLSIQGVVPDLKKGTPKSWSFHFTIIIGNKPYSIFPGTNSLKVLRIEENGCIIPKEKDSKPSKPDGIPSINISTRYQDGKLWVWFKESESYHWLPKGSLDTLYLDNSGLLVITANQGVYCCKLEKLFINANHSEFKSDIVGSYSALLESELRGLGYTIEVCKDYLRVFRA